MFHSYNPFLNILPKMDLHGYNRDMVKYMLDVFINDNIKLDISDSAKDYLVENGYDPAFGARPLKRLVGRTVEVLLSNMIINNEIKPNSTYLIDYKNDKFVIEKE